MPNKSYQVTDNTPKSVHEPAVAYQQTTVETSSSDNRWDPNVPFHGTQEEWWEHFHKIEEGQFYTIEEADKEFEIWKKQRLANRI